MFTIGKLSEVILRISLYFCCTLDVITIYFIVLKSNYSWLRFYRNYEVFFLYLYRDHRDLHVLTHSSPTRRSSELTVQASANYSSYSKSVQLGFTEPYLFDRNISLGGDIYRRDFENFNFVNNDRNTTYKQLQTGGQVRVGVPLTEYMSLLGRYSLNLDDVTLDEGIFFTDPDGANGPLPPACDPLTAGRYLCDAIGERTTSSVGYSLIYDTLDNRLRPSKGERLILNQDFAGLGGSVKYLRTRASAVKYFPLGSGGFVFSTSVEGGYIHSFEDSPGPGRDPVSLIDRLFLGESQLRGFDIRGVGPRVIRRGFDAEGNIIDGKDGILADDAL